jgi:type I restriction enzyme S subunit
VSGLPRGWAVATLPELIGGDGAFSDGDWVETKDQDPHGDVRLTQLADVGDGAWRNRSQRFMTREAADRLGCTFLRPGDVLVARMPDPLGRACVFPGDPRPSVTAVDVCIVRPGSSSVDARWLMWWLNTPQIRSEVLARQAGTTRKRISRKNLAGIPLPVPPLAEQRRIVAAIEEHLSRLDAAEAALASAAGRVEALSRRVRNEVTRLAGEHVLTGEVTQVQGGIQKQPKRRPIAHRFPFLRVANVRRDELDLSEVHEIELFDGELERLRLEPGDLLVVEGNGSPEQIGRCAMWRGEIDNCVHQNHLIRVRPGPRLDPSYLGAYWNAPSTAKEVSAIASSTSGLYTLSTAKVRSVPIVVPPLDEQRRAVAELEEKLSSIRALQAAIRDARGRATGLRRSILARAFRGELVPQDPDDEPANALLERIVAERAAAPVSSRKRRMRTPA